MASGDSLLARILTSASAVPGRVAIVCGDVRLTFREMVDLAIGTARHLDGIAPEEAVAVCADRKPEFIVGALATLIARGSFLPIDPEWPAERIEMALRTACAKLLIDASSRVGIRPDLIDRRISIDSGPGGAAIAEAPAGDAVAYHLLTSGSTGGPKLVSIEHRSVCALLDAFEAVAPSRSTVISTSVCPFVFDVSLWELLSALTRGGTIHILEQADVRDPARLASYIIENRVTTCYVPPHALDSTIDALTQRGTVGALERVLVGVEPILQSTLQRLRDLSPGLAIINGYGPTETTICSTFYPFRTASDPGRRTPIGWAVAGSCVEVVDEHLAEVPVGTTGEIVISGAGLARGYANDPAATARAFVQRDDGRRWYRTGDFGRKLSDGALEFINRRDDQTKIRGYRIQLGEVEAALLRHPEVRRAMAVAVPVLDGASLILFAETRIPAADLRKHLAGALPNYMMPSRIIGVAAFPVTDNGKVDRAALTAPRARRAKDRRVRRPTRPRADDYCCAVVGGTADRLNWCH
jgi:amino acid adenylation domain-containing protein